MKKKLTEEEVSKAFNFCPVCGATEDCSCTFAESEMTCPRCNDKKWVYIEGATRFPMTKDCDCKSNENVGARKLFIQA